MARTTYYTASSLDGFLADEHDSLDWLTSQPTDEHGPMGYADFITNVGALAMGANTYQWLCDHAAASGEPWAYDIPCWVFTHRRFTPIGQQIVFTCAPIADVHAEMTRAAGGKDVWIVGGGDLAAQFADAGLLDEMIVSYAPVTLGGGKPLFAGRHDFELVDFDRNGAFLCARYGLRPPTGQGAR
jgi:dihydrofolate reductase